MIEGGGLGVFKPEEVGPTSVQEPNGVIDILVENEEEAVEAAKKYLSYFQGPVKNWKCSDQVCADLGGVFETSITLESLHSEFSAT